MAVNTNTNMSKAILCRSVVEGGGKCNAIRGRCRFAHNLEEFYPRLCKYGDKCNRHKDHPRTCLFVHPDEDIHDYASTHGFVGQAGPRSSPITRETKIGKFENHVKDTDTVRKRDDIDFSFSTEDWPDLSSITPVYSPCEFDNAPGSPLEMSDLEMENLIEPDDWPLPLVFSSNPSPLQRQTSTTI